MSNWEITFKGKRLGRTRKMYGDMPPPSMPDLNPGDIWVSDFSDQSAKEFRDKLQAASMMNPEHPIIVRINTYGGEADNLASMISALEEIPNPIITVGVGKIMSAGAILLSYGDFRFIDQNARVMIHQIQSYMSGGNITQVRVEYYETERLNNHMMSLLAANCGYESVEDMLDIITDIECYMEPEDAVDFGLADAIGLPMLEVNVSYKLRTVPPKPKLIKYVDIEEETEQKEETKQAEQKSEPKVEEKPQVKEKPAKKTAKKTTKKGKSTKK